ncbi:murein L,D-transpeptidase [Xanthobacter autotrophicus]|uniref:L,D-transpeptidase family protein n=1 Tax=Xanthobacter TaxID=279 RepID=UPI0024AA58BE|nr:murein L,D-transpeptidase family protein [Xanthobacter autotrophicus]MDI4664881.1 murein L,D-transpeptidase [Xanthobacter autotrophicus]
MNRFALNRPWAMVSSRIRMVALAATAALALAACNQTDAEVARKANKPLSPQMVSLLGQKDMSPASPMLVRIFKQEAELEVWKATSDGSFALLKTYPICRWSGELGPKVRMGDRQAPEGFYTITPGQMNPNSSYYLSFNLGFPNAFDKAYGRTGEFLMVHGDCSSAGCYAMTDEQISEIFSLARESFAGGQRAFQVQAYPFRMTPKNLARHRNNPNMAFWRNLKQGYDHFEVTKQEPKVNVCGRAYVFDAEAVPGRSFDANASCPPYQVAPQVASAVAEKQRSDEAQVAALVPSAPLAPVRTNSDGGMHPVFLAKLKERESGQMSFAEAPGTLPEYVNPPKMTPEKVALDGETAVVPVGAAPAAAAPVPAAKPAQATAHVVTPAKPVAASASSGPAPSSSASAKPAAQAYKPATVASAGTLAPPASVSGGSAIMPTGTFAQ